MLNAIFGFIAAFLCTRIAIPVIIRVAQEKQLFDEPDGRKHHRSVIPTLGGLGIYGGIMLGLLLFVDPTAFPEFQYLLASMLLIFFLGMKDDILIISATKKFMGQLAAAGILIFFAKIRINDFHGMFGLHQLPEWMSILFSLLTMITIINSYNLIDGIDGLAGGLGILSSLTFGLYFLVCKEWSYALLCLSITGSLFGFIFYNFPKAQIFMGDTGSLILGLLLSIVVIKFIKLGTLSGIAMPLPAAPAIGFSILMVPLFDTIRVFTFRILQGDSPFKADRMHIHHLLLDAGFSSKKITAICILVNLLFIGLAYAIKDMEITLSFVSLFLLGALLTGLAYFLKAKRIHSSPIATS